MPGHPHLHGLLHFPPRGRPPHRRCPPIAIRLHFGRRAGHGTPPMKPTKPSSACGPETNATGGCGSSVDRMPAPNGGLPPAGGGVGHGRDTLALQRRSPAKVGGRASETTTNQKHEQRCWYGHSLLGVKKGRLCIGVAATGKSTARARDSFAPRAERRISRRFFDGSVISTRGSHWALPEVRNSRCPTVTTTTRLPRASRTHVRRRDDARRTVAESGSTAPEGAAPFGADGVAGA